MKKWLKLHKAFAELADNYKHFTKKFKKELFDDFGIDCGTDYANHIFAIGNIKY